MYYLSVFVDVDRQIFVKNTLSRFAISKPIEIVQTEGIRVQATFVSNGTAVDPASYTGIQLWLGNVDLDTQFAATTAWDEVGLTVQGLLNTDTQESIDAFGTEYNQLPAILEMTWVASGSVLKAQAPVTFLKAVFTPDLPSPSPSEMTQLQNSVDGIATQLGTRADAEATTDGGTFSLIALVKRIVGKITSVVSNQVAGNATLEAIENAIPTVPDGLATADKQDSAQATLEEIASSVAGVGTGLATAAKQDTQASKTDSTNTYLDTIASNQATSAQQTSQSGKLDTIITKWGSGLSFYYTGITNTLNTINGNIASGANAKLDTLHTDLVNLGTTADTPATTDAGTFSLIALVKRGLAVLAGIAENVNNLWLWMQGFVPTQGQLESVKSKLDTLDGSIQSVNSNTTPISNIETDLGAVNGSLVTINADTTSIASKLDEVKTKLDALAPATSGEAVTPSDSVNLGATTRAVFVGGAGNISVQLGGATILLTGVQAGTILPIAITRVNLTSTTATFVTALY